MLVRLAYFLEVVRICRIYVLKSPFCDNILFICLLSVFGSEKYKLEGSDHQIINMFFLICWAKFFSILKLVGRALLWDPFLFFILNRKILSKKFLYMYFNIKKNDRASLQPKLSRILLTISAHPKSAISG